MESIGFMHIFHWVFNNWNHNLYLTLTKIRSVDYYFVTALRTKNMFVYWWMYIVYVYCGFCCLILTTDMIQTLNSAIRVLDMLPYTSPQILNVLFHSVKETWCRHKKPQTEHLSVCEHYFMDHPDTNTTATPTNIGEVIIFSLCGKITQSS